MQRFKARARLTDFERVRAPRLAPSQQHAWTAEDQALCMRMAKAGFSQTDISLAIGTSQMAVSRQMRRAGVHRGRNYVKPKKVGAPQQ